MVAIFSPRLISSTETLERPIAADLSRLLELGHGTDAFFDRHPGIHRVELVKRDLLDTERLERPVTGLAQLLGARVPIPASGWPNQPTFGGDQDALPLSAPLAQGPRNQSFVMADVALVQAVDIRRIDQGLACIERRVDDLDAHILGRASVD